MAHAILGFLICFGIGALVGIIYGSKVTADLREWLAASRQELASVREKLDALLKIAKGP